LSDPDPKVGLVAKCLNMGRGLAKRSSSSSDALRLELLFKRIKGSKGRAAQRSWQPWRLRVYA